MESSPYVFTSQRLGFRNWKSSDVPLFAEMNKDPDVMAYFPSTQTEQQSAEFIERMQKQFKETGFTYFAVDTLSQGEFIGFIGLSRQIYPAPFTPCIDLGWRLKKTTWKKGYASEGAKACIQFGFHTLKMKKIYSVAPLINEPSVKVMIRAGMKKEMNFEHPSLLTHVELRSCVVYSVVNPLL